MVSKIKVNCNFNGVNHPIDMYIGNPSKDSHPLGFQAKWLADNSGGRIPDEFMKSVSEVKKIADENKVSFEDLLCHLMKDIETKNKKLSATSDQTQNNNKNADQ